MDLGRLQRGRSYSGERLDQWEMKKNVITARVRGNINPYFGVTKTPYYKTKIVFDVISDQAWKKVLKRLSNNAGWVTRLMLKEMPDDIEECFDPKSTRLLPGIKKSDFKAKCSCPDGANPCKHIAGMYYRLATLLDKEPMLLFQLRGLSLQKLYQELEKTPLGQALVSQMDESANVTIKSQQKFFIQPEQTDMPKSMTAEHFWSAKPLPDKTFSQKKTSQDQAVLLLRKQGDYPEFWNKQTSFLQTMDEVYQFIAKKN